MYGVVNRAIQELITTEFGNDQWLLVKEKANLDDELFISNRPYPDEVTYELVAAVMEVTGLSCRDVMHAFGEYWILETGRKQYGDLVEANGDNFVDFLRNLPDLHARIQLIFPHLQPPDFDVSDVKPNQLKLHYISKRGGLEDFVVGLIKGTGKLFQIEAQCELICPATEESNERIFQVSW